MNVIRVSGTENVSVPDVHEAVKKIYVIHRCDLHDKANHIDILK